MNQSIDNTSWISSMDMPINVWPMPKTQQVYRYLIIIPGTLINILVAVVIGSSRQLHYPRHIFWAGISLSNQLYITQGILEIAANVGQSSVACQFFVFGAGANYTNILLFLAFAALDRYLAISRYDWYKRKVTNRGVLYLLLGTSLLTYFIVAAPFWTGFKSINNCSVNLTHMHTVLNFDLLVGVLCVILHIMIFIRSRAAIIQHSSNFPQTPLALRFVQTAKLSTPADQNVNNHQFDAPDDRENAPAQQDHHLNETVQVAQQLSPGLTSAVNGGADDTNCFPWFQSQSKLNRLEVRAALSMSINVLPVWLCTFPVTLNAIALYWCIQFENDCSTILYLNPYIRDLFLIHSIYNPMMYMSSSTEFRRALLRLVKKCKIIK